MGTNSANDRGYLLLTRLREESQASATKLRRRGWSVCCAPLLSLEALPATDLAEKLDEKLGENLGENFALVITSKSALRMLARTPAFLASQNFTTRALAVYAVGEESAALATAMGFASVRAARGTLESLIEEILQHHPKSQPVLHLCGRHRRGNLVESLQKMGYSAGRSVLYEAVSVQQLPRSACNLLTSAVSSSSSPSCLYACLFYSPRTADVFSKLYAQTFGAHAMSRACLRFVCLSPSIGVRLQRSFPAAKILCAALPSEASLFDALEEASS